MSVSFILNVAKFISDFIPEEHREAIRLERTAASSCGASILRDAAQGRGSSSE
jgi:hypothetical protein